MGLNAGQGMNVEHEGWILGASGKDRRQDGFTTAGNSYIL